METGAATKTGYAAAAVVPSRHPSRRSSLLPRSLDVRALARTPVWMASCTPRDGCLDDSGRELVCFVHVPENVGVQQHTDDERDAVAAAHVAPMKRMWKCSWY